MKSLMVVSFVIYNNEQASAGPHLSIMSTILLIASCKYPEIMLRAIDLLRQEPVKESGRET